MSEINKILDEVEVILKTERDELTKEIAMMSERLVNLKLRRAKLDEATGKHQKGRKDFEDDLYG